MPPRILLADDHVIVRQGFRALLEREGLEVVAEAANGHEAVRLAGELLPDVAVLDFAMPLLNGLDAAKEIRRCSPRTRTILLTVHSEDHYVLEALQAGVHGYVVKTQAAADLVQAIREIRGNAIYLSPTISRAVVEAYFDKATPPGDVLSSRERQVLQLVAEGKTTKEIAGVLGVSIKTADSHRARIMRKLDIHDTAGLVRFAIRRGLIHA
ncbi:MAG TPA: response regulator transcription factor [Gemmatimonadaceae bacterium]|nr:MAG: DNA-binding response regulator [Acidobacteriota bacterium]PYQ87804.1 MAG: DNA-binding response regulator [Acidobacteriota bacterium]PYR03943.1 MAG: DNA-binding response regulator [Acidobacteriota bacterium]PYR07741.1 MAG: DNA-binding response regulator [Acidobacteriota bacterium]HKN57618.1 response regulator transcription factor [Gemmatimonadaceae bacterium]